MTERHSFGLTLGTNGTSVGASYLSDRGNMRKGFLGMGDMSEDEQINAMLFVILALSLECVLEGLLQGSPERFWVFHGIAAAISVWGLSTGSLLAMRLASIAGVTVFLNELELIWNLDDRARLIVPTFVLLSASIVLGWKAFNSGGVVTPAQSNAKRNNRLLNPFAGYEPYIALFGSALVLYSLGFGQWVTIEKWFGLSSEGAGFSDIRALYKDLGVSGDIYTTYLEVGYLLSYASAGVGAVINLGNLSRRLVVSSTLAMALAIGSLIAAVWHSALVLDLVSSGDDIPIGLSAWAGSVGLALISAGAWMNRNA